MPHSSLPSLQTPINDDIWYKNLAIAINRLASLMKTMANQADLKERFTYHSVRKTMCSNLLHSGVHPNDIAQLSGHKNAASLNSYATASKQKQLKCQLSLIPQPPAQQTKFQPQ